MSASRAGRCALPGSGCSDITYIPVRRGFLYLVAIMDWATRKVLAWRLSNTLDASFCVEALSAAIAKHCTPEIMKTPSRAVLRNTLPGNGSRIPVHRGGLDHRPDREIKISMPLDVCQQTPAGNRWPGPLSPLSSFPRK